MRNLLGEENERTIPLQLEQTRSTPPEILSLHAVSISEGDYAPATFRVESKLKNAELCVWNFDDEHPLEISDPAASRVRFVTFTKPGGYSIKLAAINGKQAKEKTTIVYVNEPPAGALAAVLSISDVGTRLEKLERAETIPLAFPPQ